MNKVRRKKLAEALELLEKAQAIIEEAHDEEEEAFDNLPESLQASERGETMQDYIDRLEEVGDGIQESIDEIGDIVG